jgi:hypothetical protein
LQDDVVDVLASIGLKPQKEMLMPSGYRLDAYVMVNGVNVGVKVGGPSHFTGYLPNGHTILKRRQVPNIDGAVIVSVPYWEWEALENIRPNRQEYLSHKLRANPPLAAVAESTRGRTFVSVGDDRHGGRGLPFVGSGVGNPR